LVWFFFLKHFHHSYRRLLVTFGVLFFLSIIAKNRAYYIFVPTDATLMLWDYVFYAFSCPLIVVFFFPIFFCYLISDIYKIDFTDASIAVTLLRSGSRFCYYSSKAIVIILSANIFFVGFFCILILVAVIFRMPVEGEHYFPMVRLSNEVDQNIADLLIIQHGLSILYLVAIGLFVTVLSLIFSKISYAYLVVLFLAGQGYNAVMYNMSLLPYSIFAFSVRSHHYPFLMAMVEDGDYSIKNLVNYTTSYVILVLAVAALSIFAIGWHQFRKKTIATEE